MSILTDYQKEISDWGDETFNHKFKYYDKYVHINSLISHFMRESEELNRASFIDVKEEAADCFLLLLHIAEKLDFDLFDEAQKKHIINTKRKWGKPDKYGVIEHIREG